MGAEASTQADPAKKTKKKKRDKSKDGNPREKSTSKETATSECPRPDDRESVRTVGQVPTPLHGPSGENFGANSANLGTSPRRGDSQKRAAHAASQVDDSPNRLAAADSYLRQHSKEDPAIDGNGGQGTEFLAEATLDVSRIKGYLHVRILAAHGLPNKDTGLYGDVSDPYVVARVGNVVRKTPYIENCLDPVWERDNEFSFAVGEGTGALELEVFNSNVLGDDSLGKTSVPLWRVAPERWTKHKDKLEGTVQSELSFELYFLFGPGSPFMQNKVKPKIHYPSGRPTSQPEELALPLYGVRVLELSQKTWTTALCGRMLAATGADVVRIPVGADAQKVKARAVAGKGAELTSKGGIRGREVFESARANLVPQHLHAGKRVAPHDLNSPAELAQLHSDILPGCDMLLTDLPCDELERLRLGYNQLRQRLPNLDFVHVSSVGTVADVKQKGVEDAGAFFCLTGFAEQLGHFLGPPGFAAATAASALFGVACLAIMRRRCGGYGDRVELSVFRSGRWCTALGAMTKWARPPRPDFRFGSGPSASSRGQAVLPFDIQGCGCIPPPTPSRAAAAKMEPLHFRWNDVPPTARTPTGQPECMVNSELPLARVTVIEASDEYLVSAAALGSMLADLGAQVTKIERPQRPDPWKKTCKSLYDELNGKKHVQLLNYTGHGGAATEGQAALYKTLSDTTMFVTNLPAQALHTWGLGVSRLHSMFPHLVIVVISSWGSDLEAHRREAENARKPGQEEHAFWEASGLSSKCFNNLSMPPGLGELAVSQHALGAVGLALLRQQRTGCGQVVDVSRHHAGCFTSQLCGDGQPSPMTSPLLPVLEGRFARLLGRGQQPHDSWLLLQALGLRPSLWKKFNGDEAKICKHLENTKPETLRSQREELVKNTQDLTFDELATKLQNIGIDWFVEEMRLVDAEVLHKQRASKVEDLRHRHQDAVEDALRHADLCANLEDDCHGARAFQDQLIREAWEREQKARWTTEELQRQWNAGIPPMVSITIESGENLSSVVKGDMPDTYCVCQVLQKQDSRIQTDLYLASANPQWNFGPQSLQEYSYGDAIMLAAFSRDHDDVPDAKKTGDGKSGEITVTVCAAYNLKNLDTGIMGDVSDPYVVLNIAGTEFKTPTINDNLNPVWTDSNQFQVRIGDQDMLLKMKVMNSNYMQDDSLGFFDLDIRTLPLEQRHKFKVPLVNGDGAELELECFVKPPHPCEPHHEQDQLIGRADVLTPQFYPNGFSGPLVLFFNQKPIEAVINVRMNVDPRDMQRQPLAPPTMASGLGAPTATQMSGQAGPPMGIPRGSSMGSPIGSGVGGPMATQTGMGSGMGGPGLQSGWNSGTGQSQAPFQGGPPFGMHSGPQHSRSTHGGCAGQMGGPPVNTLQGSPTGSNGQGENSDNQGIFGSMKAMLTGSPTSSKHGKQQTANGPVFSTHASGHLATVGGPCGTGCGGMSPGAGGIMHSGMVGGSPYGSTQGMGGTPAGPCPVDPGAGPCGPPHPNMQLPPPSFAVKIGVLHVRINGAYKLLNKDTGLFGDYSDPYVVVRLGRHECKTSTINDNLNPEWDCDNYFTFEVSPEDTSLLALTVMNSNRFKDDPLGNVDIDLRTMARETWCRYEEKLNDGGGAVLEFDTYFSPTEHHAIMLDCISMLYLRVNGALNLTNKDTGLFGDVSDPYVLVRVGQIEKRTPTINNNLNPVWDAGNMFTFVLEDNDSKIELEVMNHNNFKDDCIGRVDVDLHELRPDDWNQFQKKLVDGDGGEVVFDAYLKTTEVQRRKGDAANARNKEEELGSIAAEMARQLRDAEYSAQWLSDAGGRSNIPLSVEENDWEQACGGRNFVIPAWIYVNRTQAAALQRTQQPPAHQVALFPDDVAGKVKVKARVKIASAEGLRSTMTRELPNAYCLCEVPMKPESQVRTAYVPENSDPVWRHSKTIRGYEAGDSLVFNVYNCSDDARNSHQRRRDELLGTASLDGRRFYPDGFDGILNLTLSGRPTRAKLRIILFVSEEDVALETGEL